MIREMTCARRAALPFLLPCAAACLAGCATPTNRLWTVDGVTVAEAIDAGAPTEAAPPPAASRGADRSGWAPTAFVVPVGWVAHQPTYATPPAGVAGPAPRHDGRYPTPESAVDASSDPGARALDALAEPFLAAADIVLFPIRAAQTPPWSTVSSPAGSYQRAPNP